MEHSKQVFIVGITGNQGGAVARHLLKSNHKVVGLTRNADSDIAKKWRDQGVNLVQGNLLNPDSYKDELEKSDSIFLVQSLQKKDNEIAQAKSFINTLSSIPGKHLVYSSVLGADLNTGVPHFESKNEIEKQIKSTGISHSILRPASFYENYLFPRVADGIRKGKFVSPLIESCTQQMIGVDHIGKIASQVISNPDLYSGKTISIATDEYHISELPQFFSKAIKAPVKYKKLPGLITRLAMGRDLHKMFKYMNKHDFCVVEDVNSVRNEFGIQGNFEDWIKQYFSSDGFS